MFHFNIKKTKKLNLIFIKENIKIVSNEKKNKILK